MAQPVPVTVHKSYLFAAALVNASAVGRCVASILKSNPSLSVTLITCGERWPTPNEDGDLRFAIEDYLGAGAVLSHIPLDKSPEARLAEQTFVASKNDLLSILRTCGSGLERLAHGPVGDIEHCAKLDLYPDCVPILRDNHFQQWTPRAS